MPSLLKTMIYPKHPILKELCEFDSHNCTYQEFYQELLMGAVSVPKWVALMKNILTDHHTTKNLYYISA